MTKQSKKIAVNRRSVLKGAAAVTGAALGTGALGGFPTICVNAGVKFHHSPE